MKFNGKQKVKYAPRKVYILENGKYAELEYTEFEKQKSKDFSYNDKFFIPVQGCLLEVAKEQYESFYRAKEREKYADCKMKLQH